MDRGAGGYSPWRCKESDTTENEHIHKKVKGEGRRGSGRDLGEKKQKARRHMEARLR